MNASMNSHHLNSMAKQVKSLYNGHSKPHIPCTIGAVLTTDTAGTIGVWITLATGAEWTTCL